MTLHSSIIQTSPNHVCFFCFIDLYCFLSIRIVPRTTIHPFDPFVPGCRPTQLHRKSVRSPCLSDTSWKAKLPGKSWKCVDELESTRARSWCQVWNRKKDPNEFFWKIKKKHFWVVMLAKSLYNISTKLLAQKQTLKVPSRWPGACAIASGDGPRWPATVINFGWDEDHPSMDIDLSKSRESKFYEKMQVM